MDKKNTLLIQTFPGELTQYYSFDEAIDPSEQSITDDFLNVLTPNGLPLHELLFRTINPSEGLSNGTHLIFHNIDHNVINAEIAVGHHSRKRFLYQESHSYQMLIKIVASHSSKINSISN